MKNLIFHRENNDFKDILTDVEIKPLIKTQIYWNQYLILGLSNEAIMSYVMLKYSDSVINFNDICPDRTPMPNLDYIPNRHDK